MTQSINISNSIARLSLTSISYYWEGEKLAWSRYKIITKKLVQVRIGCLKTNAGLFCWMDLRVLLEEATVEGELVLWRTIIKKVYLNDSPVLVPPSTAQNFGWFSVYFANIDNKTRRWRRLWTRYLNQITRRRHLRRHYGGRQIYKICLWGCLEEACFYFIFFKLWIRCLETDRYGHLNI